MTWGERNSDVLCSPADVSRLVKKIDQHANEDDILHADDQDLENFGGTLSTEEARAFARRRQPRPVRLFVLPACLVCLAWSAGRPCLLPPPSPSCCSKVDSYF